MTGPEILGELREVGGEVRAGDTLVVRIDPGTPADAVRGMRDQLEASLPPGARVVVVGCEQLAVVRGADN